MSNGEGSGYVLLGTGLMLNKMLGEEDINRGGFHRWPVNRRLASMMAPTLVQRDGQRWLLGSGGSNRIRTALVQVLDFDMGLEDAVVAPRLHLEGSRLSFENPADGWPPESERWLQKRFPEACRWDRRNLYFGGVHAVGPSEAAADPRRHGTARKQVPEL